MLSIINNPSSVVAMNNLSTAQSGMASSIQRLSSGLRINGAADDPSGLAISERLRTQINGLGRASMNAQDGISYMQTAEGALNETHSILQRMRELSIQAANGTLTASDRQTIQEEVGQLTEEVDRIATSTEFNTKKLLNGDASALWSSSSDKIGAVVRGRAREGNYELEITAEPGKAQVLKTDIFEVKEGLQSVSNIDLNGVKASLSGAVSVAGVNIQFDFNGFEYVWKDTAVGASANAFAQAFNEHEILSRYAKAIVISAGTGVRLEAINDGEYANSFRMKLVDTASGMDLALTTSSWTYLTGGATSDTGVLRIDNPVGLMNGFGVDNAKGNYVISVGESVEAAANTATKLAWYAQGTTDGFAADSNISALGITVSNVSMKEGGAYAMVEFLETSRITAGGTMDLKLRFSFDEGETWTTMNFDDATLSAAAGIRLSDGTNTIVLTAAAGAKAYNSGDKLLIGLNDLSIGGPVERMRVTYPVSDGGTATTQNTRYFTFAEGSLDSKDVTLDIVQLDVTKGEWYTGSIHMDFGTEELDGGKVTFDVVSGGPANSGTKLRDIGRFYDDDGNFVLGENGKYLTVYNGAGDETKVYIDGGDTIEQLRQKLNDAIAKDLGMAVGDMQVDSHIVDFVEEGVPGTDGAVEGTVLIRSTMAGTNGNIYFSAEEDVLNALSLATIQQSSANNTTVVVRDAHTKEVIGSDTVSDGTLHNVIEGIDVDIDPRVGTKVSWNGTGFDFSKEPGAVEYLHVVDNAKSFQIGANQNQTMDSFIGQMDAHALGVDRVLVVTQDSAQRSIGFLDEAIDKVSGERARIGSVMNRLEHTINNLNVQQENAIAAESRIRDLDIAKEATEMAKWQILNQASTSMLAQANQMAQGLLGLLR